ncbi:MAG TPA: DUF2797 domain-containing protein [Candidatus Krumholzibacteria bacterium]|nr:DUF2797 domain-containing protein [Candidatus Krumholzibacteria bacterium]HRX51441.1 DUF2797 domain-containing protein [Candidatus Krumholzibacteria bacterium]
MDVLWTGTLTKMRSEHLEPVAYHVRDGWYDASARGPELPLGPLLGRRVELRFTGEIHCVYCGRAVKKIFNQGFCYPCGQARAEADICIVKPELCHHGEAGNPCRDEAFAQSQCFQPHVLYVSLTSGTKVGITRRPNVPSRWIDQGAVQAIPLAVLPSRREVGLAEAKLAETHDDKTHWMRMLKGDVPDVDLRADAAAVIADLEALGVAPLPEAERVLHEFTYPVLEYPTKVKSFNLDKAPTAGGVLHGVKGQYLIFDAGVINLRKYTGYKVEIAAEG